MSACTDRENFIVTMQAEGMSPAIAGRILNYARTLHCIAELECSSEAAARDRVPCPATVSYKKYECCCNFGYQTPGEHSDVPRVSARSKRVEYAVRQLCASVPKRWRVTRDGKVCYIAPAEPITDAALLAYGGKSDETHAWKWLHAACPSSIDHATKHEGYKIEHIGVVPIFNGDPRGAVLKLSVPSGRTDDWGQEGICVPS